MIEIHRAQRGHAFLPSVPLPAIGSTESIPLQDKVIVAHWFLGGCAWWICEYDPVLDHAFGYACLNDPEMAEWGYVSLRELEAVRIKGFVVERNMGWVPTLARHADLPGFMGVNA